ncbi:MAG: hypothetical protein AAF563_11565 [Pseudomonadota bacterium]
MERINQYAFYQLAKQLAELSSFKVDTPPNIIFFELWTAEQAVGQLLDGRPIPVGVSRAAVEDLKRQIDGIKAEHFSTENTDGEREFYIPGEDAKPVEKWRFSAWRSAVDTFETVFSAEMAEATTYYIPQRGIYDTAALIDRADDSFPSKLQQFISEKSKEDWRAAGRCLALNLCTASGFHVVRAVEATLESYYQAFTNQPGATRVGWHDYLKDLEGLPQGTSPEPNPKVLAVIRQMKDDYRNPVVHPRVVLTEADARMLFNNGESALIGMAQGLMKLAGGSQSALALIPSKPQGS